MKSIFLAMTIGLPLVGYAKEVAAPKPGLTFPKRKLAQASVRTPMASTLLRYFDCSQTDLTKNDGEAKLTSCVKGVLAPEAKESRVQHFVEWLLIPYEITAIRACSVSELDDARAFPERTADTVCFDFQMDGAKKSAIAYFTKKGTQVYLHSLYY